ncbi:DUF5610 domain-containing protein [Colwellia echini]|uniref:DUF5610 domain-containing protein n=1 Tax=Colwellia echini TaxID=1982103 RepID=A0ABY3N0K5_9GAMM|nr:DUF5610 domain-containing protein [Colwellia echini]TYK66995.1 hypothetical protein CWS31_000160 [Colwellia echini]
MNPSITANTNVNQGVRTATKTPEKSDNNSTGQEVSSAKQDKKIGELQEPISVSVKKQLNASIIESSLKFSDSVGDKPLSLVLKTALQGINEALQGINEALQGADVTKDNTNNSKVNNFASVEDAAESGVDYSPEATAERIVSFSTQFLSAYREQNPDMSEEESLNSFVEIIRGGIEQGFGEAKEILDGLNVLEGEVSTTIDKTYELVQSGLQAFIDSFNKAEETAEL